jgi:predicted phosphodiesterase
MVRIRSSVPNSWVIGNHDAGLVQLTPTTDFNADARHATSLHQSQIQANDELWKWCQAAFHEDIHILPQSDTYENVVYVRTHACLKPGEYFGRTQMSYLVPWESTRLRWNGFDPLRDTYLGERQSAYLLYGHTHFPTFCELSIDAERTTERRLRPIVYGSPQRLGEGLVAINPGSVGQPRDGDRRAAYAIVDTAEHTVEFRRVEYRNTAVLIALRSGGYPIRLQELIVDAGFGRAEADLFQKVYRPVPSRLEVVEG